jgi:PAS domain S-box-containing protein
MQAAGNLSELIDALPAIVWRGPAAEIGIAFVNRAAESILGYPREAWVESPTFWREHLHPDDRERVLALCLECELAGRPYTDEYRMIAADGRPVWLRESVHFLASPEGTVEVVGVITDVSAEKLAEASLRDSRERFEILARAAHEGLWDWDLERDVVWRSEGYEAFLGYRPAEANGPTSVWRDRIHSADVERVMGSLREALDAGEEWSEQYRLRRADGEWAVVVDRGLPLRGPSGEVVRMLGAIIDVTDRERAAEAERQAQHAIATLAAVVESSQDAIASVDAEGRVMTWNAASERLSGFSAAEVVGRPIAEFMPPSPQRSLAAIREVLGGAPGSRFESEALRKDGSRLPVSISVSPVRDALGDVIGASTIVRDASEARERERERGVQMRRLASLRSVDLAIAASLDLRIVSAVILQQMTSSLGLDAAAILLFDSETQSLRFGAGRGFEGSAIRRTQLRIGESLAGEALLTRRPVYALESADALRADRARAPVYDEERVLAYAACPLVAKGRPVGVLEGFHRLPLEVGGDWREFLETLAGQAAIAVDNVALFDGLQRTNAHLAVAYDATIEGWSRALDLRDKETEGHSRRVTELTLRLARAAGLGEPELVHVRRGALLHDIGKLGIPDAILHKPGRLDEEEWAVMRRHPQIGRDLLAPILYLRPALDIPYCHHERWDGGGYPRGLAGEAIPRAARIFAIADAFDALRSDRPYRPRCSVERAVERIATEAGIRFDPRLVDVFLASGLAGAALR